MFHRLMNIGLALLVSLVISFTVSAETRFVGGTNNGLRTYVVVKRNGVEFRTDELGVRVNEAIWNELSSGDRKALLNVYGWQLGRRADHFGLTQSNAMADWINQEQGWTAAAEALKTRHANKNFPTLAPVFGPGASLVIPGYSCVNLEIINSDKYKEAARLDVEIRADYAVGQQVYDMLVNAKWEQISIAVKTLSEPLIKIIVDNFITGFVTNGASKVSELAATAYGFANDLKDFIAGRQKAGNSPPTPAELIERLEKYIADMEATAETAVFLVQQKKDRLQLLADQLKSEDAAKTKAKADAATAVRSSLNARTAATPSALQLPDFPSSPDPNATQEAKDAYIRAQAETFWFTLYYARPDIATAKSAKVTEVVTKYSPHLGTPYLPYGPERYLADASDQFTRPYFEIMDQITKVDQWITTDLPVAASKYRTSVGALAYADADVSGVLDAILPQINDLQARALWLDKYAWYLGFTPSGRLDFGDLRNFDSVVNIAAIPATLTTPEKSVADLIRELDSVEKLATEIQGALGAGTDKRQDWINSESTRYDSLRFNFENSLSYVIAALTQLDRLHAGPFFERSASPYICYGAACLYTYSVNVEAIKADIQSKPTAAAKETARVLAVQELLRLRAEEEVLAQRLAIAQDSHLNDFQAMNNFFNAIFSRYQNVSMDMIIAEFEAVTGKTIKGVYDLYQTLIPDITYYFLVGSTWSWIRNGNNVRTGIGPAVELVSGKITEYYLLLDFYNRMAVAKSYFLGLSLPDFDAFMTDTTKKLETYGEYQTAFRMNNVWGVDYPAWQLFMKTQYRRENLNSEYRHYPLLPPVAWEVRGRVTTSGEVGLRAGSQWRPFNASSPAVTTGRVGVPGVTVMLDGYLTTSTTTASDGSFFFDFIGSGTFTLTAFGQGYQIIDSPAVVTVVQGDVQAGFTAVQTAESGYSITGRLALRNGVGLKGVSIVLTSAVGEENVVFTGPDGSFGFLGVGGGTYALKPVSAGLKSSPAELTVTLPKSVFGANFVAYDAIDPIPTGIFLYLPLISS
jgi:hypothetical protein